MAGDSRLPFLDRAWLSGDVCTRMSLVNPKFDVELMCIPLNSITINMSTLFFWCFHSVTDTKPQKATHIQTPTLSAVSPTSNLVGNAEVPLCHLIWRDSHISVGKSAEHWCNMNHRTLVLGIVKLITSTKQRGVPPVVGINSLQSCCRGVAIIVS